MKYTMTEEHRAALRERQLQLSKWHLGKKRPNWWREKLRNGVLSTYRNGRVSWNKGKVLKGNPSYAKVGKQTIPESRRIWLSKRFSGPNAICWKGGITPLRKRLRYLREQRIWWKKVADRDKGVCQKCFGYAEKGNREVNHITPFWILFENFLKLYPFLDPVIDKEKLVELAKSYQPFWNVSNGEVLCKSCHHRIWAWDTIGRKQSVS